MNYTSHWISYETTNAFSSLIKDYLNQQEPLIAFQKHSPDLKGVVAAIEDRKNNAPDRELLVSTLKKQYEGIALSEKVENNISLLESSDTFTICTAHQPNLFTGYLYFIYKIVHAIKVADELNSLLKEYKFVPVYYMGSEDNDLEELNRINLNGEKLVWQTAQTGAVGRMNTKGLDKLISDISGQLDVFEYGPTLTQLLKQSYLQSTSIQEATFRFVDHLFKEYGLIVLIPDDAALKKQMLSVFKDDLFLHTPAGIVQKTAESLSKDYHTQVNPREINLFYMKENIRERIVEDKGMFNVNNTEISFTREAIEKELNEHPERFSPNVVLRGLYQETLLPNIVFIGGGSEVAYWLELKELFAHYTVPFPVLLLRNSFLIIDERMTKLTKKLEVDIESLFKEEHLLLNKIVKKNSAHQLSLTTEFEEFSRLYGKLKNITQEIDVTLTKHVASLEKKSENALRDLEKKMIRAEKRKYNDQATQLHKLKSTLFPNNSLQERVENILPYYARYGKAFIEMLYQQSPTFDQKFGIIIEN